MPLGQNKNNFNYNLDEKRVLNFENVVDDSDNVKQDMSIDVYGRQTDEEKAEAKPDTKSDDKVHITKTRQVASCLRLLRTTRCVAAALSSLQSKELHKTLQSHVTTACF